MAALEKWMKDQFDERRVEPNSGLGEAISYMQTHWESTRPVSHVRALGSAPV